jgi:hypothetical protein
MESVPLAGGTPTGGRKDSCLGEMVGVPPTLVLTLKLWI